MSTDSPDSHRQEKLLRETLRRMPVVGSLARAARRLLRGRFGIGGESSFRGSSSYWEERYSRGQDSGSGSYNHLAQFKAEVLNDFVRAEAIETVMELGCGDGNQLALANYPDYTGFDVSETAIRLCRQRFRNDPTRRFHAMDEYASQRAELVMSLDVIYHLVEDEVFDAHMRRLFESADRFVVIYSSDTDEQPPGQSAHVRHRKFSNWIARHAPSWSLKKHIPNRHPFEGDSEIGSFADFHIYARD